MEFQEFSGICKIAVLVFWKEDPVFSTSQRNVITQKRLRTTSLYIFILFLVPGSMVMYLALSIYKTLCWEQKIKIF